MGRIHDHRPRGDAYSDPIGGNVDRHRTEVARHRRREQRLVLTSALVQGREDRRYALLRNLVRTGRTLAYELEMGSKLLCQFA